MNPIYCKLVKKSSGYKILDYKNKETFTQALNKYYPIIQKYYKTDEGYELVIGRCWDCFSNLRYIGVALLSISRRGEL